MSEENKPAKVRKGDGRRERVFRFEGAFSRAAQMRGHHHSGTRVQRELDTRCRGANAGVFGDIPGIVLRHIQVGTDKNTFAGHLALGTQIRKADEFHGGMEAGGKP